VMREPLTGSLQLSFLQFSVCRITLTFRSTLKTFLLLVTVALLSRYQCAVNCSSRNAEGKFTHAQSELPLLLSFSRSGICVAACKRRGMSSQGQGDGRILNIVCFFENYIGKDDCSVVISGVDSLTYVVLRKTEKPVSYGELVGTIECMTL
jgi:hypothetical protein